MFLIASCSTFLVVQTLHLTQRGSQERVQDVVSFVPSFPTSGMQDIGGRA